MLMRLHPSPDTEHPLQLFIRGNEEITRIFGDCDSETRQRLLHLFRQAFGSQFEPKIVHEPAGSACLLAQQLDGQSFPDALSAQGLDTPFYTAQFADHLFQSEPDVVLFSIEPDLRFPLWRHKDTGYLIAPELEWQQNWPTQRQDWLREQFEPLGLTSAAQFEAALQRVIVALKERYAPAILLLNASSIDHDDDLYTYGCDEESLALRVNRFNLAVLQLSTREGVSIVDVDRLVAEFGADHVQQPLRYSAEVNTAIAQELIRIIADLGIIQSDHDIFALRLPYVDRSARTGIITAWHKQPGDAIAFGDPLIDLVFEAKKLRRTQSSHHLSRRKSSKAGGKTEQIPVQVVAAHDGILREIYAQPETKVEEGSLLAVLSTVDWNPASDTPIDVDEAGEFKVNVNKVGA